MVQFIKSKIHYPKILLFLCCVALSIVLFKNHSFEYIIENLNHHGYAAMFLAGCLFSYGFTTPFAVALMIELSGEVNLFYGAALGAAGALASDFLIFSWVKFSMASEFNEINHTRPLRWIRRKINAHLRPTLQKYLGWVVAGIIIGSPLPDEIGVSLLTGFGEMDKRVFAFIDYSANVFGIGVLLALA